MPVCPKCEKESNNLRMCPFCHTEYYPPQRGSRQSVATPRASVASVPASAGRPNFQKKGISPVTKFGMPVLIVGFGVWYFVIAGERRIPVGVVIPNIVNAPMPRMQAEAFLKRINATAKSEVVGDVLVVTFTAAMWPEHREGQIALAQQYARADEIIEGKKRKIDFHDPLGVLTARADLTGVMMVK